MDNEEIQGVKFSEFPSATPDNADDVVGLHAGDNARFSIANIVTAVRNGLANIFVPLTRTINSKALTDDITLDASDITYDPTTSGLTATNVQDAIDEVYGDISSGQGIFQNYQYINTGSGTQIILAPSENYQMFFLVGQGGIHGAVNAMNGGTPQGNIAIQTGYVSIALVGGNNIKLDNLGPYKDIFVYSSASFSLSLV